jgi:hypothetical protein
MRLNPGRGFLVQQPPQSNQAGEWGATASQVAATASQLNVCLQRLRRFLKAEALLHNQSRYQASQALLTPC